MTKDEAIRYFKTQQGLAAALGIHQSSVSLWEDYPPDRRQVQIERITGGALRAEPECEARLLGLPLKRKSDRKQPQPPSGSGRSSAKQARA